VIAAKYWSTILVVIALGLHVFLTTKNVSSGFLAGHEFRQAQTGLSIKFIQRDQDYSLAYPTPLFGPPWSISMEFPLYQWAAAWLGTQFDLTTPQSGRAVSIASFYLMLPAIVLLLRTFRFSRVYINYALILVLTAPVFIYYTRAILIESTVLCFSVWFLYFFVRLSQSPHWTWCFGTMCFGSLAAILKVTTFMVWGSGALIGGIWWFMHVRRTRGVRDANRNLRWAAVSAIAPVICGIWWIVTADQIEALSPSGDFLTSANLREFNLGGWTERTSLTSWLTILDNFGRALFPSWLFGILGASSLFLAISRRTIWPLILTGWAAAVWAGFPGLYRIHDYYFYAMALLPLGAVAFTVAQIGQSKTGRFIAPALVLSDSGFQLHGYFENYADTQFMVSNGGSQMERFIRDASPPDSVIIVVGAHWSPQMAYYMERRSLMILDSIAQDAASTRALLACLDNETVAGLLVVKDFRSETDAIAAIARRFNIESEIVLSDAYTDLRVTRPLRSKLLTHLAQHSNYDQLMRPAGFDPTRSLVINTDPIVANSEIQTVTTNQAESIFYLISPSPLQYRAQFGFGINVGADAFALVAHPNSDFWVEVPSAAQEISAEFGLQEEVYFDPAAHTDGASFEVWAIDTNDQETQLFARYADPHNNPKDRGKLETRVPLPSPLPVKLGFAVRPGPNGAYDWAYWGNVTVR
jgi:hypothetical protein